MTPSLQEVALTFDAEKHRYFLGNAEIPSVTAVTGIISKGDGLLQWAVNCALGAVKEAMRPGKSLDEVQIDDYGDRGEDFEMPAVIGWFWQRPIAETQTSKGAA